jgi:hypothetical protein
LWQRRRPSALVSALSVLDPKTACTFAGSIGSIYHCACNYVPGILRLGEMWDVAGLIAPRGFCAIAGRDDPIFPIQHTRRAFEQLERIYAAAGARSDCQLYVGDGGHRSYSAGAWPFIRRYFGSSDSEAGTPPGPWRASGSEGPAAQERL